MSAVVIDKEKLWTALEELGETTVRENLATKIYGEQKRPLVEEWLRRKAETQSRGAEKRRETAQNDQNQILRSTKNAAWVAAGFAGIAAICAVLALLN